MLMSLSRAAILLCTEISSSTGGPMEKVCQEMGLTLLDIKQMLTNVGMHSPSVAASPVPLSSLIFLSSRSCRADGVNVIK